MTYFLVRKNIYNRKSGGNLAFFYIRTPKVPVMAADLKRQIFTIFH